MHVRPRIYPPMEVGGNTDAMIIP